MPKELAQLIEATKAMPEMTPRERDEQIRNFAAGNIGLENPRVTRAVVDEAIRLREMLKTA